MPEKEKNKSVLFVGQAFYNHWYLSRELRKIGWRADQLNTNDNDTNRDFFHGEDFSFASPQYKAPQKKLRFYLDALCNYEIFHFANAHGIVFLTQYDTLIQNKKKGPSYQLTHRLLCFFFDKILKWRLGHIYRLTTFLGTNITHKLMMRFSAHLPERWDILLLKKLGKKIVYTNNGCLDGVLKSTFSKWNTPDNNPICSTICHYKDRPDICSDERNRAWGEFRNSVADYQCVIGGNRADFNLAPTVHERPEIFALDKNFWAPDILIPTNYRLPFGANTVKLFHSVGNFDDRNQLGKKTIKSTHIYFEVVERLKNKGYDVEIIFFKDVPNKIIRYYQAQSDIFIDMLSFGSFGANIREGLMLGKPCICYMRPEWLEQMRAEVPEYADELPIISATPQTIEEILIDLITNREKRKAIGEKSRKFAVKWHSAEASGKKFDEIYKNLLQE